MKIKYVAIASLCVLCASQLLGQGTIAFGNRVSGLIDAPFFDLGGAYLSGPNAYAQLYAGGQPVGSPVTFRTGAGAGYWPTTSVTIPGVAAGAVAVVQVKVWKDAQTYEAASFKLESAVLSVTTGGAGSPPTLPAYLVGLTSVTLVPEPEMLALALLTACTFAIRRKLRDHSASDC